MLGGGLIAAKGIENGMEAVIKGRPYGIGMSANRVTLSDRVDRWLRP